MTPTEIEAARARIAELDAQVQADVRKSTSYDSRHWRELFKWTGDGIVNAQQVGANPKAASWWLACHQEIAQLEHRLAQVARAAEVEQRVAARAARLAAAHTRAA